MTNKYLKFILSIAVILCVCCSSLIMVMAVPDESEVTTEIETGSFTEPDVTVEDTTEKTGGLVIGQPTTEATTSEPTTKEIVVTEAEQTTTSKKPSNNTQQTTQSKTTTEKATSVVANATTTTTPETTLPQGSFYVYLELNNGQPRLKRILTEPGLVPKPNEPVRQGYTFAGWYADAKLTKIWDFSTSIADEKTVIYAKWIADASTVFYNIKVSPMKGGTVQVNPMSASEGEPVIITVLPDEGKRLVAGSLKIDGKASDVFSFEMPAHNVVINAKFEDIPAGELTEEEDESRTPFFIAAAVVVLAGVIIAHMIAKRRADLNQAEFDENGALIIDDDDDDGWIDESIVIEDGFANGKKVRENVQPDYGEVEENNDD